MQKVTWICLALCLLWGTEVRAQAMPLRGTVVSVSVISKQGGPAGPVPTIIYVTPKTGHFVLTQVGSSIGCGTGLVFSVNNFGPLGSLDCNSSQYELLYSPGLALPQGASIECVVTMCTGTPPNVVCPDCYITGVLEP
jgi:hypothetical protein